MKLLEALKLINEAPETADKKTYDLVCGFTPLSLFSFFHAHLIHRSAAGVNARASGHFGDLEGNLRRAANDSSLDGAGVVIEWQDLDRRLGYRHGATIGHKSDADIVATVVDSLKRLIEPLQQLSGAAPVSVCLPTLPLPPIFGPPTTQSGSSELAIRAAVADFAQSIANIARVRVVSAQRLDRLSSPADRLDFASDLRTGFPYSRMHADVVGSLLALQLVPPPVKKGLITDLDDTLWRGILGEVGPENVSWSLDGDGQIHALYQQLLASLADRGILVAVASKNEAALVARALAREDLLVDSGKFFPVLASWGAKSAAVEAILSAWNVGADSVVFVDDSRLELAEVQARFPTIECVHFPREAPPEALAVLEMLRDKFGSDVVREEDRIRADSLRARAEVEAVTAKTDAEAFLTQLDAAVTFASGSAAADGRAFELLNKTNQFNLNGRRIGEAEWQRIIGGGDNIVISASYRDKYGPLGKIAVAYGSRDGTTLHLKGWVMSCRAFARRIEHQLLATLFRELALTELLVDYAPTERNGPLQEFLNTLGINLPAGPGVLRLEREFFEEACPALYHEVRWATATN